MSHGLAASIRSSTESETFDLAGQNVTTIENTIRDAFNEPMELTEMIRLTFVTGAGKLGRARYDDNAAKAVTSTLRELGYEEDRGASAVLECGGSFKLQHDTGKNLKTVVVFPKVASTSSNTTDATSATGIESDFLNLIVEDSVSHKIAYASMNIFPRMVESQCITWSQKKACISALQDIQAILQKFDDTLLKGQQLSESEQNFYDSLSATSLEEKVVCLREIMAKQIDKGEITAAEKRQLIQQVDAKIEDLTSNITTAEKEGKVKRVENLKDAEQKAKLRRAKLESIAAKPPPKLKMEAEISKLRTEMGPLLDLELATKGRLLTLKESQSIARKDELQNQITDLELASRGWFETDEAFEERVSASRKNWQSSKPKTAKKSSASGTNAGSSGAQGKWTTAKPTPKQPAWSKQQAKPKAASGGGLFAAMMQDSDSD